jgi:rRNA-processing protein FCF1
MGSHPRRRPDLVGSRNADDKIVELAQDLDRLWWLVTSDRLLRERVGDAPEQIIVGGSFVRAI